MFGLYLSAAALEIALPFAIISLVLNSRKRYRPGTKVGLHICSIITIVLWLLSFITGCFPYEDPQFVALGLSLGSIALGGFTFAITMSTKNLGLKQVETKKTQVVLIEEPEKSIHPRPLIKTESPKETEQIKSLESQLKEIKRLYENELIDKDEYDSLRKKILGI